MNPILNAEPQPQPKTPACSGFGEGYQLYWGMPLAEYISYSELVGMPRFHYMLINYVQNID